MLVLSKDEGKARNYCRPCFEALQITDLNFFSGPPRKIHPGKKRHIYCDGHKKFILVDELGIPTEPTPTTEPISPVKAGHSLIRSWETK